MCLIHLSRKILLLLNCENRRQLSSCVLYACIMSSVINCWNGFIPEKHWFWDPLKLSFVWGEGKGSNHLSSLQFLEASFTSTFRYILLRPIFLWKSCLATTFSCKPILFLSLSRRSISLRYVFICLFFFNLLIGPCSLYLIQQKIRYPFIPFLCLSFMPISIDEFYRSQGLCINNVDGYPAC